MSNQLDSRVAPFDRLTAEQLDTLQSAIDIDYFAPGETILAAGAEIPALFIVLRGAVEEREGDDVLALYGPGDRFDTQAIVQGDCRNAYVARAETLLQRLPRDHVLRLIRDNPRFGAFFYADISRRLDAVMQDNEDSRFGSLMHARVADLFLHPAVFIDAADSIETAGHRMREANTNALFVRDGERTGIVTGMNLSKAVILQRLPITAPVGPVTHYAVITVTPEDFVVSALILMTRHNKRRVAVRKDGEFVGILEDIDLIGFLAGSAQLLTGRIERATGTDELSQVATEIGGQVKLLRRQGVKVEVVSEIVSDLNRHLLARTFSLLAPPAIRENSCLIVMGSEGRGEQTIRTDQDNGLILGATVASEELEAFRADFTQTLIGYGFPPCPGNVMVRNPFWSKPLTEYLADFNSWIALPGPDSHMNIAIFYDAVAVAGQAGLLDQAKAELIRLMRNEKVALAHFARAIESFSPPIGFFNNILTAEADGAALDVKKGGIFPIVHGVRSLSIERGILATGTAARITQLAAMGALKPQFARDLTQAFRYLSTLRLDSQLASEKGGADNLTRPGELSSMERDLLRDALKIVKDFREIVRKHFNLGMF